VKAFVNWHIFTQTSLDSGSLTMLGTVLHNFSEPGNYIGTILRNDKAVGNFHIAVNKESPATQIDIDLATLHRRDLKPCNDKMDTSFTVNPKGYAVFYVSRGAGGYAVVVGRFDEKGKAELSFDSRELQRGDMFAATMIRPGTYTVTNITTEANGEIVVAYPKPSKVPYRPPKPVSINCTKGRLSPNKININASQGQVYHIKTPSRLKINLVQPDDGPSRKRKRLRRNRLTR
jgi:hypothetical protein